MHKFIVTLMASLLSCSVASAFWPEAADSLLEIGVGYRWDKLEWKTSNHLDSYSGGYDCYDLPVGVSSRLKWRDLRAWQIEARAKFVTCDNVYFRANGDYGWIVNGKNTDSDYMSFNGDYTCDSDSSVEFAHTRSKAKGHLYDAKLAVGYQFRWCDESFAVAPLIGYSWHGQHIHDRHLRQDYCDGTNTSPLFETYDSYNSGRNAKYHTRWNGPFIGFDFDWRFGCCCEWDVFGGYEFHWAEYHARAHWDLRKDICDGFRHRAKHGYGHVFDIGVRWDFCECWTLALKGEFQCWWADKGRDRAKIFSASCGDASTACHLTIPLRHIRWHSACVAVDVGMVF